MPGYRSWTLNSRPGRDSDAVAPDALARQADQYPLGQWRGIHGHGGDALAARPKRRPGIYQAGQPWLNGTVESFNGKLRDECLNRKWFANLQEATLVIEQWRHFYNHQRPHSALGYKPPATARRSIRPTKP